MWSAWSLISFIVFIIRGFVASFISFVVAGSTAAGFFCGEVDDWGLVGFERVCTGRVLVILVMSMLGSAGASDSSVTLISWMRLRNSLSDYANSLFIISSKAFGIRIAFENSSALATGEPAPASGLLIFLT